MHFPPHLGNFPGWINHKPPGCLFQEQSSLKILKMFVLNLHFVKVPKIRVKRLIYRLLSLVCFTFFNFLFTLANPNADNTRFVNA